MWGELMEIVLELAEVTAYKLVRNSISFDGSEEQRTRL